MPPGRPGRRRCIHGWTIAHEGIGADVVSVTRIERVLDRTPGLAECAFTAAERAERDARRSPGRAGAPGGCDGPAPLLSLSHGGDQAVAMVVVP